MISLTAVALNQSAVGPGLLPPYEGFFLASERGGAPPRGRAASSTAPRKPIVIHRRRGRHGGPPRVPLGGVTVTRGGPEGSVCAGGPPRQAPHPGIRAPRRRSLRRFALAKFGPSPSWPPVTSRIRSDGSGRPVEVTRASLRGVAFSFEPFNTHRFGRPLPTRPGPARKLPALGSLSSRRSSFFFLA